MKHYRKEYYTCDFCNREMNKLPYTFGNKIKVQPFFVDTNKKLKKYTYHLCSNCYDKLRDILKESEKE